MNSNSDAAMMAIPSTTNGVASLSSGSYLCAPGMSCDMQMYTIMPATNPNMIP